MKLSTRGRYGLKAMFDLALNYGDGPISLTSIAERQAISVNYLEQLISPLRKAGLVESVRGAQGGYMLAKRSNRDNCWRYFNDFGRSLSAYGLCCNGYRRRDL